MQTDYAGPVTFMLADNGSTDETCLIAKLEAIALGVELVVIHEPKPGKANALNDALRMVETPYVVTVDADTLLHRQALRRLVARLESAPPDTVAVAGAVMIRNSRANLLTRMQEWDYFLGIAAVKRMQGLYQSTLVAQGAFSLYRTDELRRVGGWPDAIGEDIVVTWRLMETGDRVLTEPTAIAFTDAPTQVSHFMRQRARWARGMVEAIRTVPPWRQRRVLSRFISGIDLLIPLLDIGYGLIWVPGLVLARVRDPDHRRRLDPRGAADHAAGLRRIAAIPAAADLHAAAVEGAPQRPRLPRVHPRLSAAVLGGFARRLRAGDRGRPPPLEVAGTVVGVPRSDDPLRSASRPRLWTRAPGSDLAKKAEDSGFDTLYVADHLGATASPFAALTAAALATSTLRIGTYVLNVGIRDPLAIASDAATLDVLSNGRFVLGLGAGHTPAEWTMTGREYPTAADRVGRLVETVEVVTKLLRGEVVTHHGRYVHVDDAYLLAPRPVQPTIPLLIGGNGARVLRLGGTVRRHREPDRDGPNARRRTPPRGRLERRGDRRMRRPRERRGARAITSGPRCARAARRDHGAPR